MRPSQALALNRDTVLRILAHYPVKNPKVFGSVARGDDTEESDLDILVEHVGGLSYFDIFRLEDALADALGVRVSGLLEDLLQWGEEAKGIADGRSKDDFLQDRLAQLALAKAMEVVGEIAGRLIRHHPDWAGSRRETGLDGAYRFRNRISHGYDSIDFVLVWETARKDLPDLLEHARKWLAEKPQ